MSSGIVSRFQPSLVWISTCSLKLRSGYLRGTGPVSQTPGHSSVGMIVLDEMAAGCLVLAPRGRHEVEGSPLVRAAWIENSLADVRAGKRCRIGLHQSAPQRHQPAGMIVMIVAEHHVGDVGKIDVQLLGVVEHGLRPVAGVEKNSMPIHVHDGGKSPLADAVVGSQHGGQHLNSQRTHLLGRDWRSHRSQRGTHHEKRLHTVEC